MTVLYIALPDTGTAQLCMAASAHNQSLVSSLMVCLLDVARYPLDASNVEPHAVHTPMQRYAYIANTPFIHSIKCLQICASI